MMSIIQGGCGLPFLARPMYDYLVTGQCTGISHLVPIKDIPDAELKFVVTKVYTLIIYITVHYIS